MSAVMTQPQGWHAELELGLSRRFGRTALTHRKQRGPLAVQRPLYPEGVPCHLCLLHPPGGIVGGDRLEIRSHLSDAASAVITTPGATKFYRSAGAQAEQRQQLQVEADATLEWLPQENIFFPGAIAKLQSRIELAATAHFIGWEIHCFGLPVVAQPFDNGALDLQLNIESGQQPLLIERLAVNAASLHGAAGLRQQPVSATLLATPASQTELEQARNLLQAHPHAGVTLLDQLLVIRYLGPSTEACKKLFIELWSALRPTVIGLPPCPPRIWST